ncbi:MAG TPA: site-2 protease family protein [Vicinamibacterales bacterium]|nr:site-2 protease family protein [Vicinamibacterales bacterium]
MPPLEFLIPTFVILILSLSFHEAAHAWSADRLGDPTARTLGRLTLNPLAHIDWIGTVLFPLIALTTGAPLIGWAKPVPVDPRNLRSPRRDFAIVALAGPVSNLILAAGLTVIFFLVHPGGASQDEIGRAGLVLYNAIATNVLLAVFNMIPIPPLDGGNVAIGILPPQLANLWVQLRPWGFLLLYAMLLTGVVGAIVRPVLSLVNSLLVV